MVGQKLAAQGFTLTELSVPLLMVAVHRVAVGLKYAAMSARELRLFLAAPEQAADAHSRREQLLSGVLAPRVEYIVIEFERAWREVLASGAHKAWSDDLDYAFRVDDGQADRWADLVAPLGSASALARAPLRAVPVGDVLCALVLRASRVPLRVQSGLTIGARARHFRGADGGAGAGEDGSSGSSGLALPRRPFILMTVRDLAPTPAFSPPALGAGGRSGTRARRKSTMTPMDFNENLCAVSSNERKITCWQPAARSAAPAASTADRSTVSSSSPARSMMGVSRLGAA
jgi:hypothetical protein